MKTLDIKDIQMENVCKEGKYEASRVYLAV